MHANSCGKLLTLSVESDINGFQNKQLLDEAEHDINDDI